jgi:hypothetical protein
MTREEPREVVARALRNEFAWTFPLTHARALELADTAITAIAAYLQTGTPGRDGGNDDHLCTG